MNGRQRRELDRWILRGPDEEPEYCEDGECGVCPGCRFQEGDEEHHRRVDRELERMTSEEWDEMMRRKHGKV